ncbi:MarR family transcriptional regulator [Kribbella sp. VKM Ac-2569]|uniref:MarR family transcriptional regulator n=1 Tax=Kribbella sp. VKM Ac-2569 TaxID=2512220 RepID=UPI001F54145D|nr:MarR family transcriptional regulator [Kribbella sp. VKM Ac-2569]
MTIEDAGIRPLTNGSTERGSEDKPVVANALVVPERVIGGVVPSPVRPGPTGIAAVQTEHLISDVGDALRLLDAVERVRGHAHPLILGLQEAIGIKMPAALVLSAIASGRTSADEVAKQVGITAGEAELAIADLEALGMVRTTPGLTVTSMGQARLSQLDGLTVRVLDVITGILGPTDAAHLVRLLHTVADGLESASVAAAVNPTLPQVIHN